MNCSVSPSMRGRHTVWWALEMTYTLLINKYKILLCKQKVTHEALHFFFWRYTAWRQMKWAQRGIAAEMLLSSTLRTCECEAWWETIHSLCFFFLSVFFSFIIIWLDFCSFDALVLRFEAPDSRNRWDSPLFTILKDDALPLEAISDALFKRKAPPANQSTQSVRDFVIFCFVLFCL